MILLAVKIPSNALCVKVAVTAVNVHTPRVPSVVGHANGGTDAIALVANTAWEDIAMHSA